MKSYADKLLLAFFVLFACTAQAFDSTVWLEKRARLDGEAERLRVAYSNCLHEASALTPAENVAIPIDTYEDGSVKSAITARRALYFHDKGLVWAEDVLVRKYDVDGEVVARIEARHCVVDRNSKSGWAEGPAELWQGKTVFTGQNVYFSSPEGYVSVTRDSDVTSSDLRFGGRTR